VEGRLVGDLTVEDRLDRLHLGAQGLERRGQLVADPTLDVNLVPRRRSSRRRWNRRGQRAAAESEAASPLPGERGATAYSRPVPTPSEETRGSEILRQPLVAELLAARLIAVLATLNADGSIHAVPMWFAADGQSVALATGGRSRKVANVRRDPRATLVLHDSRPGMEVCGASLVGLAEVVEGAVATPLVARVHARYVSEVGRRLPEVREFLASDDVALRFVPERALTWDERPSDAARVLARLGGALPLVETTPRA
jgi:PPOX class probable F420-dependent enzyme